MKTFQKIKSKVSEEITDLGLRVLIKAHEHETNIIKAEKINNIILFGLVTVGVFLSTLNCAEAVTVDALRTPIQELKKEIFGGWMIAVKIIACAVGAVATVFKQSMVPVAMGVGTTVGIHFGDKWIGDGSAALI